MANASANAMANAKANASPVKNHSKHNVSDALDTVYDNFVDASRPHIKT